jgi:hypothetical protein
MLKSPSEEFPSVVLEDAAEVLRKAWLVQGPKSSLLRGSAHRAMPDCLSYDSLKVPVQEALREGDLIEEMEDGVYEGVFEAFVRERGQ